MRHTTPTTPVLAQWAIQVLSYFKTVCDGERQRVRGQARQAWHRRRGRPQHQGCAAHDGEAESPDQSKLWLPIKFLLDKIDDVSCIPLEKCDTFRTHVLRV